MPLGFLVWAEHSDEQTLSKSLQELLDNLKCPRCVASQRQPAQEVSPSPATSTLPEFWHISIPHHFKHAGVLFWNCSHIISWQHLITECDAYQSKWSVSESPGILLTCRFLSPRLELLTVEHHARGLGICIVRDTPCGSDSQCKESWLEL